MLDLLYAQAVGIRRSWYERHPEGRRRLQQAVISVGNLSVGGTGKTPLVRLIVEWLIARGERPSILSRGYGRSRRQPGVVVVSDGTRVVADVNLAGDEPLMLAQGTAGAIIAVSEDRHLAGVLAERKLGATVHVLDDGFQHVRLARDLDVLVTGLGEILGGRVLPFGRLREAPAAAARADVLVVMGADEQQARAEAWQLGVHEYCAAKRAVGAPGVYEGRRAVAVAGIGDPQQFFSGLRQARWDVADTMTFRDHHAYTATDVHAISQKLASAGADLVVTTEKDAVRLEQAGSDRVARDVASPEASAKAAGPGIARALPFDWTAVPVSVEIEPRETLFGSIEAALLRARERS